MVMNLVLLLAPVLLAPLVIYVLQMLFPIFLKEGAKLFTAMELPGSMARKVGTDIAVRDVGTLVLCWAAGFGCHMLQWHYLLTVGFAVGGVLLALLGTITLVKKKLAIRSWTDAGFVGLVAFAGGNLPLFVIIPLLLLFAKMFGSE